MTSLKIRVEALERAGSRACGSFDFAEALREAREALSSNPAMRPGDHVATEGLSGESGCGPAVVKKRRRFQ